MPPPCSILLHALLTCIGAAQNAAPAPPPAKPLPRPTSPDNLELVRQIHALIVKNRTEKEPAAMKDYAGTIPKTGKEYKMAAIRGGEFLMGSPATEKNRRADEGPQVKVRLDSLPVFGMVPA